MMGGELGIVVHNSLSSLEGNPWRQRTEMLEFELAVKWFALTAHIGGKLVGFMHLIHTTEGNVVHYGAIEQFILQLGERFNIREIAYDRWNATMMVQTLEDDGFTMVPFGQGYRDMSPPTKELMRLVLERKLNHGGHPVLRWNMDNAYVRTDPAGNLKIDKEKSTEKVDGAVALVMALDRALKNANTGASVYDDRGFLII